MSDTEPCETCGYYALGTPVVDMPAHNRQALDAVPWPQEVKPPRRGRRSMTAREWLDALGLAPSPRFVTDGKVRAYTDADRLTQPDWCNAPQPGNWQNACMRAPGHDGDHACRKDYRRTEAWSWPDGYPVRSVVADQFPDLWQPAADDPEAPR